MTRPDIHESAIDLVRDVARVAGGPSYYFYAPMVVPDATTASVLRRQPDVFRAFERFPSVTKAVVAIGGWNPPASMLYDALSPSERKELLAMGACADVSGVPLDGRGRPLDAAPANRMVRISAEELGRIPEVIGLAYGSEKAAAVRAAITGGYITSLVTHTSLAQRLLASS
jgi:DNA-binding transcriptional regulator LsrR (DeoR family)